MTSSSTPPGSDASSESGGPDTDPPFDPYRFGHPEVPPAPEYAPPGYTPPPAPAPEPGSTGPGPWGAPQYGQPPHGQPPNNQPPYNPPSYAQPPYGSQPPYGQQPPGQAPWGQAPYGQQQYGAPPWGQPYGGQYPAAGGGNGKAVTALVLGIASIVFFWTTIFDAVLIIPAIIFGVLALNQSKISRQGRGKAISGLVCAGVGAAVAIAFTVFALHVSNSCSGTGDSGSTAYRNCLRDQF